MTMAMTMAVMTLSMTRTQMDLVQSCLFKSKDSLQITTDVVCVA